MALWHGEEVFTAVFRTGIPPEGAPPPVRNLRCEQWVSVPRQVITLAWDPPEGARFDIEPPPGYAGVTDVRPFMVTAVDTEGRESGYADDRKLARFAYPGGRAKVERSGEAGRQVRVTLGPQGSVQLRESLLVE